MCAKHSDLRLTNTRKFYEQKANLPANGNINLEHEWNLLSILRWSCSRDCFRENSNDMFLDLIFPAIVLSNTA